MAECGLLQVWSTTNAVNPNAKFGARRVRKRIGKLQRQCRRAFWASDASELPTSALVAWCYVRSPRPLATWQREGDLPSCAALG